MALFTNRLLKPRFSSLAWDSYAVAEEELVQGQRFSFQISQDEVGVAVGVQSVFTSDRGAGYGTMIVSVVATTKRYAIYEGATQVVSPVAYDPTKEFAIDFADDTLTVFFDGVSVHTVACTELVIPVASLYSPWDAAVNASKETLDTWTPPSPGADGDTTSGTGTLGALTVMGGNITTSGMGEVTLAPLETWGYGALIQPIYANSYLELGEVSTAAAGAPFNTTVPYVVYPQLPALAIFASGAVPYAEGFAVLPALTLSAADALANTLTLVADAPAFTLEARMRADGPWGLQQDAPGFTLAARSGHQARVSAPGFTLTASATMPVVMRLTERAPSFTLTAHAFIGSLGGLDTHAPSFTIEARTGHSLNTNAPGFTAAAQMTADTLSRLVEDAPGFTIEARATADGLMRLVADAPSFVPLYGVMIAASPGFRLLASIRTDASSIRNLYCVNLRTGSLSRYSNYPFDFFGQIGNAMLGANEDGLYLLAGEDDAGVEISAAIALPDRDFGTTLEKRLPYVYVESRTDGAMRVTTTADEERSVSALTTSRGRNRRAKLARGVKGVMWAVRIENTNGEFMAIDSVDIPPTILRRKV